MSFGKDKPLIIDLGDEKRLTASGYIDRVDIKNDGNVEITDYKSGSKWIFDNLQDPKDAGLTEGNAQLALYYLAIKELARTSDDPEHTRLRDVTSMSYRFVTAKGDYDIVSLHVDEDSEDCYKAAFAELLEEIETGYFPAEKGAVRLSIKDREPGCKYCGYKAVCYHGSESLEDN
jgi:RecB family exonuclease